MAGITESLWVPDLNLSLCACKTTRLTSELLVCMGPSLHLWFLHAKLRLYDQNYKSLWVPALICCFFCIHNSVIMTRINSLYGSQTSPVVVCMQNNEISTRKTSLHWSQPSSVVFCMQNSVFWIRNTSLSGSQTSPMDFRIQNSAFSTRIASLNGAQPSSELFKAKQRLLDENYKSLWVPDLTCRSVHAKQRD